MKDKYIIAIILLVFLSGCVGIYWVFEQNAQFEKNIGIYHKLKVPFKGNISLWEKNDAFVAATYKIHYDAEAPIRILVISPETDQYLSEIRFDHTFENESVDVYVPCIILTNNQLYIVHNKTYEMEYIGPITAT